MKQHKFLLAAALVGIAVLNSPVTQSQTNTCIDTDGDGWGWDGTASCVVDTAPTIEQTTMISTTECIDTDGDGWGWDGAATCIPTYTEVVVVDLPEPVVVNEPLVVVPALECTVEALSRTEAVRKFNTYCPTVTRQDCDVVQGKYLCSNFNNPRVSTDGGTVIVPTPAPTPAPTPVVEVKPAQPVVEKPVVIVEEKPEVVGFDPDGKTIFTRQSVSGKWNPKTNWVDSYSVGNRCYIFSTFDHDAGNLVADTPFGKRTVRQIHQLLGAGPGIGNNPRYNDVQCGNGPANDFGDEDRGACPGRVDQGKSGCGVVGPKFYFGDLTG